jgi:hypothetical protein
MPLWRIPAMSGMVIANLAGFALASRGASGLITWGAARMVRLLRFSVKNYSDMVPTQKKLSTQPNSCGFVRAVNVLFLCWDLVPQAGLEPARSCEQQILSLPRLPIPPLGLSGAG